MNADFSEKTFITHLVDNVIANINNIVFKKKIVYSVNSTHTKNTDYINYTFTYNKLIFICEYSYIIETYTLFIRCAGFFGAFETPISVVSDESRRLFMTIDKAYDKLNDNTKNTDSYEKRQNALIKLAKACEFIR